MITDKHFSSIEICPSNKEQMYESKCHHGVCYICGHSNRGGFSHAKRIVGRWSRPTFKEKWFDKKEPEFISKEEADIIMEKLTK